MERLDERLNIAFKALSTMEELTSLESPSQIIKDATLQRFEYTFEAVWKAAKLYLYVIEGIDSGSPKGVIRSCFKSGIFTPQETMDALVMADDRNLTVHTYNEPLSLAIFHRLREHALLLRHWLERIQEKREG